MAKKVIRRKSTTILSRNNGTMTESAFWSLIRASLRKASMYWKPLQQCKTDARRPYKGTNNRQKWEYQCAACTKWFMDKEIQIDHIIEAGTLKSGDDLKAFVERCFVEAGGYQVLCKPCHLIKSKNYIKTSKNLK